MFCAFADSVELDCLAVLIAPGWIGSLRSLAGVIRVWKTRRHIPKRNQIIFMFSQLKWKMERNCNIEVHRLEKKEG
jgi:hypothetical protein